MATSDKLARIVSGCQKGDAECFSQIVDMYGSRCYGYFYRLTGRNDLSEDMLSELFVKLVEKIGSYKGGAFESWLFKIASNEAVPTGPKMSDGDRVDRLQVQLGKLDAGTKELIMLRFYSQLSLKEIARIRSEPIGTTLSKLHRGLKRLREMME